MAQEKHPLLNALRDLPEYNRLQEVLTGAQGPASAFGLPEAHKAHMFAALTRDCGGLLITSSAQNAETLFMQASALSDRVALLPAREVPLVNAYAASGENAKLRIATLMRLTRGTPVCVIASAEAVMQLLAPPDALRCALHTLRIGQTYPLSELSAALFDAGYELVELVEGPGQIARRGDILDIYVIDAPYPYRIEFFGDEIDRMSIYDPVTQRSLERIEEAVLSPATEVPQDAKAITRVLGAIKGAKGFDAQRIAYEEGRAAFGAETLLPVLYEGAHTLFDYLIKDALILIDEPQRVEEAAKTAERLFMEAIKAMLARGEGLAAQQKLQLPVNALLSKLKTPRTGMLFSLARNYPHIRAAESVQFDARSAPQYQGDRIELARDIALARNTKTTMLLFAGANAERLAQQLKDLDCDVPRLNALTRLPIPGETLILGEALSYGMQYPALHLNILSEHELFGFSRMQTRKRRSAKPQLVFSELRPGDFIVHETHGIGRFIGVKALTVQENTRDYLLMEYAGSDQLYIPTDQLDRVQKYIGGDEMPRLSKLGGNEWQRQVGRAKNAVKELAFDLAKLYAARENSHGFAFSVDSAWQRQFEERFAYALTTDQQQSIEQIKRDMESTHVMDRLLCGDVGYGKTEVALRAAFKAVQDSKQAAVLVPTTILAQQHYNTLCTRFAGFPVTVALLSRFRTAAEQKKTKMDLALGKVDIVVGTHALLNKDVQFKDLGLLVIDEEQRFGVGHKEQIKTLKTNVDVLTLTATPIPRTLHMSMIGIRDMSLIDTPPEQRFPVQNYVLEYSDTLLQDVLNKELGRGGQCYIVYNQVRHLERFAERLRMLVPQARIAVAHGQMPEQMLEQVMLAFIEGEHDVLLCSTIIENGIDIPNANTLFVIDADKMGLSQLYQLRGRVGRSTRLGYAYFTFARDKSISEVAHKRLTALTEFAQFGAGREIAMRDLEIRGAGSLLGAQQHGHIADIGYEYYCKLMGAAVKEARGDMDVLPTVDTVMDIPLDAHLPRNYIRSEVQRLSMYKRIAMITGRDAMLDVQEELEDRFGDIPDATQNLLDVSLLKAFAQKAQITSVTVREGSCKLIFHENAALDGARLLRCVAEYGAQLLPGEVVSLIYRKEGYSIQDIIKTLMLLMPSLGEAA